MPEKLKRINEQYGVQDIYFQSQHLFKVKNKL